MMWLRMLLTAFFMLGALITISGIDKPRQPITTGTAILSSLFTVGLVWAVWHL